ncbi:Ribulosamine/erythrulosamine 3-kinase potentially involved in protein deglycation [hydrothermal vent metagenome]|uniref:Ribulosamine/erythrulosamine 3-kinase potentially involved in protein deglycation n=1 Tax=hydrothermal vent metagenome TaxID=652676 RepID=A0A3B0XLN6_9ZZZZ
MNLWQQLSEQISLHTQLEFQVNSHAALSGGCINQAYRVSNGVSQYFVKLNERHHLDMFEAEALSLHELSTSNTIRTPHPVCTGQTEDQAYLVLDFLTLTGHTGSAISARILGQQLAAMHRTEASLFGWHRNNNIGSTPQNNQQQSQWIDFWREQRLLPQLHLAKQNGYGRPLSFISDRLLSDFDVLFESYQPVPSMLHGDLWGGNAAALADGTPVIFDPAFYYGDRETDIAMTHLFGGFSHDFYAAYNEAWPLDSGFAVRKTFYNLYHILNHLNLFGSGYLKQAISMAEQVLAEI